MIFIKQSDGWYVFYANDGETEMFRVQPPTDCTAAEWEKFIDHLQA